jgi:hypothetical protein
MQYCVCDMHRCEQSGGEGVLEHSLLPTRLLAPIHVEHSLLHIELYP